MELRRLFINSVRQVVPGDFVLWSRHGEEKPVVQDIGNYIEVVLHKKLGVTGQLKTTGKPQDIRSYEFVIHHSAIHGESQKFKKLSDLKIISDGHYAPEMIRFDCPAQTVDTLLKNQEEGTVLKLRPVLVKQKCNHKVWPWYIIAVNGVFDWKNKLHETPHSNYEFLYGKEN